MEIAGKRPGLLITDGLQSYRDACVKEYQTNHGHSGVQKSTQQYRKALHNYDKGRP
jgi:hypothetical protein